MQKARTRTERMRVLFDKLIGVGLEKLAVDLHSENVPERPQMAPRAGVQFAQSAIASDFASESHRSW